MGDFNSSDLEFSSPEDEAPCRGKRAIASIVQQSIVDRVESKKTVKTLKAVANAPSTAIARQYWYDIFTHFAVTTLRIDSRLNKTPTADDVIRFISRLPSHLQSRHSDGKVAWTVIKNAEMQLDRALTFHYADYKLTRHDALRFDATIQKLLNDGEITRDPVRQKQWLTCQIIKKLVTAVLFDAVENGTKSWDATLAGTFSLVLQAALSSRSGDIKRSAHYSGEEHLKWRDIELIATAQDGKVTLKMLIKLLWRKGAKRDHSKAMSLELHQHEDHNNVVDPTKLCVAYALRIGLVKETNWPDLIKAVLSRPSKRFVWTKPDAPVFYALTRGQRLDFGNAASIDQQRRFLCHAACLVGMLAMPVTHDIRKGAAADTFALKSDGGDTNRVRRALGHSMTATGKGLTDMYIGRTKGDSWAARMNSNVEVDPFGVQMAPVSFKKRKIWTVDIDKYCETKGLDKTKRHDRDTARRSLANAQYDAWSARQKDLAVTDTAELSAPETSVAVPRPPSPEISPDDDNDNRGFVLENIDSRLRGAINDVFAETDAASSNNEDMTDGCIALWNSSQACTEPAFMTAAPDQFIGYLSITNLVCVATPTLPKDAEAGNSREPPTKFLFYCTKNKEHCQRTFVSALRRDQHAVNCSAGPPLSLPFGSVDLNSTPTPSTTTTTGVGRKRKRTDISKASEGFPKPCPDNEICGVKKDFATDHLLKNHRTLHHDDTWPAETPCNFASCPLPKDHYFVSREAFRRHLSSGHFLNAIEAREYVGRIIPIKFKAPRGVAKNYIKTMCLFPDCKSKASFGNYSDYTGHLKKTHSQTVEQYPLYMPTAETVRLHPPA